MDNSCEVCRRLGCLCVIESIKREQAHRWEFWQSRDCVAVFAQHIPSAGCRKAVCPHCCVKGLSAHSWPSRLCCRRAQLVPVSTPDLLAHQLAHQTWIFLCSHLPNFQFGSSHLLFQDDGKVVKKDRYKIYIKKEKKIKKKTVFSRETPRHWPWLTWEKDRLCGLHLGVVSTRSAVSGPLHLFTGPLNTYFHATVLRFRLPRQSNQSMLLFSLMVDCFWRSLKVFDHCKNDHCSFSFHMITCLVYFAIVEKTSHSFIFSKIREGRTFSLGLSLH